MSHRWDCPDRWEAEREGERAHDYGRSRFSNPYESMWPGEGCEEASKYWRDGYRHAEIRKEERREEEAAQHRADMRRAELQAEEDAYYDYQYQQAQEEPPYNEEDYCAEICGSQGHAEYTQAVDRFGRRCYCGLVRYLDLTT